MHSKTSTDEEILRRTLWLAYSILISTTFEKEAMERRVWPKGIPQTLVTKQDNKH